MNRTSNRIKGSLVGTLILLLVFAFAGHSAAQTWIQLAPTGGPPSARSVNTAVYDPGSNRMIIFGGQNLPTIFNDVWVLANANGLGGTPQWIQLFPTGGPPSPRWVHGAGYDPVNNIMIVFGGAQGTSSPCANDVWLLTHANGLGGTPTWIPLGTVGSVPGPRFVFFFQYAQTLNRFIVAGGSNCFTWPYQDAYVLSNANGLGGTPNWTNLVPSGTLPISFGTPFRGASLYDPASDRLVMWGGSFASNQLVLLSGASGTTGPASWSTLTLAAGPTTDASLTTSAVYNAALNAAVFFGGLLSGGLSNETWKLSNANGVSGIPAWAQVLPAGTLPPARVQHTVVYDANADRMIVFGGVTSSGALNDVWVLTDANGIVSFSAFTAKAEITLGPLANDDAFEVKATFTLGAGSDGIDPLTEDVQLEVGTFSTTIPAGSFKIKKGRFTFEGIINGVSLEAQITPLGGSTFAFKAEGQGADLTGTVNPVTVGLTIGDDGGSTTVTAEFK